MKTKAYAKINLTLDVFEKTNGLHLLDTVIAPVNLSDDVEVNFFEDKEVTCTMDGVLQDETNSAVKAARIMIEEYDLPGADITIQKVFRFRRASAEAPRTAWPFSEFTATFSA